MTASRHPHGTPARYRGNRNTPGCRCTACRKAAVRDEALCTMERLAGNPRRVPTGPIVEHLHKLYAAGITDAEIVRAAGLTSQSILKRLPHQASTSRDKAKAILAIPLNLAPDRDFTPAIGATRRVQALFVLGHSGASIAAHAGCDRQRLNKLALGQQAALSVGLDQAIRRAYHELATRPGPSSRAANLGRRRGWHGPLAWDDIDNPDEQPESGDPAPPPELGKRNQVHQLAEERVADIVLLASAGNQLDAIAARTGLTKDYVRKRLQATRPTTLLELTA